MKSLTLPAYAKINLFLDVISKRDDGYHNIESVMQSISLFDEVCVEIGEFDGLQINQTFENSDLPCDNTNLCYKAAKAYIDYFELTDLKINIKVKKQIPCQAGLAGGSADAAAVIRALDKLFNKHSSAGILAKIGMTVGSDVGFCVIGGTCAVEGRGENIKPLQPLKRYWLVVAKSDNENVSTAVAYSRIDTLERESYPSITFEDYVKAVNNRKCDIIENGLYNLFSDVMSDQLHETYDIIDIMKKNGSLGAQMSGSGPSVFGLFDSHESATAVYKLLSDKCFAVVCETV